MTMGAHDDDDEADDFDFEDGVVIAFFVCLFF